MTTIRRRRATITRTNSKRHKTKRRTTTKSKRRTTTKSKRRTKTMKAGSGYTRQITNAQKIAYAREKGSEIPDKTLLRILNKCTEDQVKDMSIEDINKKYITWRELETENRKKLRALKRESKLYPPSSSSSSRGAQVGRVKKASNSASCGVKYGKERSGLGLVACYDAAEKEEDFESPLKNYTLDPEEDFDVNTPGRLFHASEPAKPWSSPSRGISSQQKNITNVQNLFPPQPPQANPIVDDTDFSDLGFDMGMKQQQQHGDYDK